MTPRTTSAIVMNHGTLMPPRNIPLGGLVRGLGPAHFSHSTMTQNDDTSSRGRPSDVHGADRTLSDLATVRCPGLTSRWSFTVRLAHDLIKECAAFLYTRESPLLWVVFMGGTGTGKSTLFNAFCGLPLSEAGVERPKTRGPVAYAPRGAVGETGFPFPDLSLRRIPRTHPVSAPASGVPGQFLILEHDRDRMAHLVVIDTPDVDSLDAGNRHLARDLSLLSDALVFVTSQEKYADEIPHRFLKKMMEEEKRYFFLLNKAQEGFTLSDIRDVFAPRGTSLPSDRVWLVPFRHSPALREISEDPVFEDFSAHLHRELSAGGVDAFRRRVTARRATHLGARLATLVDGLREERLQAAQWLSGLGELQEETSRALIRSEKDRLVEQSGHHLRREIRRLFARYDLLATPRRFIQGLLLAPLRLAGFSGGPSREQREAALSKVRHKVDFEQVRTALERFNRMVLETLSPSDDTSPLFIALRDPALLLSDDDAGRRILEEQDRLASWLEHTFQELARTIPERKKWGIYTTSILWGVLILSFETVVGGGFTVLDAALDSALAPFVTKGAVELFAYHEIQKIARELSHRHQEALLSVVRLQRDRYEQCLATLTTPEDTVDRLRSFHSRIAHEVTEDVQ